MNSSCLTVYIAFLVTVFGGGYVIHAVFDLEYVAGALVAGVIFVSGATVWVRIAFPWVRRVMSLHHHHSLWD